LMLKDSGVEIVELGHSDRRALFGETDCSVNAKVKAALRHGLKPLVCVGDSTEEFNAGASVDAVLRQVKLAFAGVGTDELTQCLVAYEPIWAIGEGGQAADPSYVANVHENLRSYFWRLGAFHTSVLYGGGVNVENACSLAAIDSVDGLFVGRAAQTVSGFEHVMAAALRGVANRTGGHQEGQ
jgi:triosephosphate isomerase